MILNMNKLLYSLWALLAMMLFAAPGCLQDSCEQQITYLTYEPVYKSYAEIRSAIRNLPAQDIRRPGKIYFKDQYIFISEINEGIHVINNFDPANPQALTFIAVPGNHDVAIKGNVLYADSYMDIVALDISNPEQVSELSRTLNVFPYGEWHDGLFADPNLGVAVDWVETQVTETYDCSGGWNPRSNWYTLDDALDTRVFELSSNTSVPQSSTSGGGSDVSTGVGGSMARFTIVGDYLYAVTQSDLISFSIRSLASPALEGQVSLGWGIETIFPYQNRLYIGSMTGMFIYGLANPAFPNQLGLVTHARACDPVAVEGDYAYVTLRNGSGGPCNTATNQLDVVNIANPAAPFIQHTYPMYNPHGVGIRNSTLFICDGDAGLKVYDASNVAAISQNQLAHFGNIHAWDVIPLHNLLIMIGEGGLYQYDYSDLSNIRQISHIPVVAE
jgi:hypothetical protein